MKTNHDRKTSAVAQPHSGDDRVDSILARNGGLSYLEIPTIDARRSAEFYQKVLGWLPRGDDPDHPKFSDPGGHLIGKWVTGRAISREAGLLPFIYVNQVRAAVEKVVASGGEIVKAPYAEGTLLVAVIRDPAGNIIGLWQDGFR